MGSVTNILFFVFVGLAYWPITIWLFFKNVNSGRPISRTVLALLQIPVVGILATILIPKSFPWLFIEPIFVLHFYSKEIQKYWMFFEPFIGLSFAVTSFAFVLVAVAPPQLNRWTPTLTAIVFFGAFCIFGEVQTEKLQDAAISKWNFDCVSKKSFIHSISIANEEFQFDLHTSAMKGQKAYGWSFMTLDFYEIPESVTKNIGPICL